jgi:hypothetical protein
MLRAMAAMVGLLVTTAAEAKVCRKDHLILEDKESGRRIIVKQMADDVNTGGYGDFFYVGDLVNGATRRPVVVVYTVFKASPCCVFFSYKPGDRMTKPYGGSPPAPHLRKVTAPEVIDLSDAESVERNSFDMDTNHPPWDPDSGPVGHGVFVPVVRREFFRVGRCRVHLWH